MGKNKKLFCVLVAGLLLCGIGAGVMFVEFSNLNYGGEEVYQTEFPKVETIDIMVKDFPEGTIAVDCPMPELFPMANHLIVDDTMEEGVIRVITAYDSDVVYPSFWAEPNQEESETDRGGRLSLNFYASCSDFATIFRMKDQILKDLKNNTLKSYRKQNVMELTIYAAPQTAARLAF